MINTDLLASLCGQEFLPFCVSLHRQECTSALLTVHQHTCALNTHTLQGVKKCIADVCLAYTSIAMRQELLPFIGRDAHLS